MEDKKQHGGRRSGAGRPANDRSIMVGVRITKEAADILNAQPNKYQKKVVPLQYRNKDNNNGEPEAKTSPKGMGKEL